MVTITISDRSGSCIGYGMWTVAGLALVELSSLDALLHIALVYGRVAYVARYGNTPDPETELAKRHAAEDAKKAPEQAKMKSAEHHKSKGKSLDNECESRV